MSQPVYEHIIVPFDGSDEAQHAALVGADLARVTGAELVLATVDELARLGERRVVKARAETLSDDKATMWVEPGRSAAAGLMKMVSYRPKALLCMATHARTGVRQAVYGSLSEQLFHDIDTPMFLLGPKCRKVDVSKLHHLVVGVDRTAGSTAAIALATTWAPMLRAGATVVYAREIDEIVVDLDHRLVGLVAASRQTDNVVVEPKNLHSALLDVVGQVQGSIIVTAWHPPTGFDRVLHDALVARLCRDSAAPVLACRAPASAGPPYAKEVDTDDGD